MDREFDSLPDTPAGRMGRWVLEQTDLRGTGLTLEDVNRVYGREHEPEQLDQIRQGYANVADRIGGEYHVAEITRSEEHEAVVLLLRDNGYRWEFTVRVDPERPEVVTDLRMERALPAGVAIRLAEPDDAAVLSEISRRAPLQLGEDKLTIDPGENYFAPMRLMGDMAVTYVATFQGAPIAAHSGVIYPVRVAGEDGAWFLIARSRILPEHAGGGVWSRLNSTMGMHHPRESWTGSVAFVRPDNAPAQRLSGTLPRWPVAPVRAVLDCTRLAGPAHGRAATAADAERVAEILNSCHTGEELFVPFTAASLCERLSRAPELYSWDDLMLGEAAVVGAWAPGEVRTRESTSGAEVWRLASVLDYGFEDGCEAELEALLRAWCARLASKGLTHLGVFTSKLSPAGALLTSLACAVESYDLYVNLGMDVDPPAVAKERGVYTDGVFF